MTDGHPGWFKDPNDPALARWHDGDDWTEHTLVIAEQTPGVEPAPPVTTPSSADVYFSRGGGGGGAKDEAGGMPTWAKVVAPLAVLLIGIFGFSFLSSGDDDTPDDEQVETEAGTLDDAVDAARDAGLPDAISNARAAALIQRICDAAETPSEAPRLGADLGLLPVATTTELSRAVGALGEGAEERCADDMADADDLIDDLQQAAFTSFGTTTTSPTATGDTVPGDGTDSAVDGSDGDGGGDSGEGTTRTTRRTTGTTRPRTTTTTAPPPTTTTVNNIQANLTKCSNEGATAVDKFGRSVTCRPPCTGTSKTLVWRSGTCPTPPTVPTTAPGTPPPTVPQPTTTVTVDHGGP